MTAFSATLVAPCGFFEQARLDKALIKAKNLRVNIAHISPVRTSVPSFINGSVDERLAELKHAENKADAIWCLRGGVGALTLWHDYQAFMYEAGQSPLIGYSDNTILHFIRFLRAGRIGIHGPVFLDVAKDEPILLEALELLVHKRTEQLVYPALKPLNHFTHTSIEGELLVMNLISLQSLIGCFDSNFLRGKIVAIEEVGEPHYKIYRALQHMKNAGVLAGVKALCIGHLGQDRMAVIEDTLKPLAHDLAIPLFDWPIFGHEQPNWPLLFGAKAVISAVDEQYYTLRFREHHDHTSIAHDASR